LTDLVAVREQRERRALQELAASKLHAAQREQQRQREDAALQRSREAHHGLTQRLYADARTGERNAAQICADLACLQASANVVEQRRDASAAAARALQAAVAEMDGSRLLYRQAYAAWEGARQLQRRARKAALVRRNVLEELSAEESQQASAPVRAIGGI
jgi:hypothetical protein